jgi:hypothetical protein
LTDSVTRRGGGRVKLLAFRGRRHKPRHPPANHSYILFQILF